jgi:hypothetical protein
MNACVGSAALEAVYKQVYERGREDGLAGHPIPINPSFAEWAPILVRAYGDGYQSGTRDRPGRQWSFGGWLSHRRNRWTLGFGSCSGHRGTQTTLRGTRHQAEPRGQTGLASA